MVRPLRIEYPGAMYHIRGKLKEEGERRELINEIEKSHI